MARYIDAEQAIRWIENDALSQVYYSKSDAIDCINATPTADVVEVVRCKDCKHATFYSCKNDACYKGIICEYRIAIGDENFFCACGEARIPNARKESEDEK